jgi:hypothetical protein
MPRILKLLQQLGVFSARADFTLVAVIDKYSMSERTDDRGGGSDAGAGAVGAGSGVGPSDRAFGAGGGGGKTVVEDGALVQEVVVPIGALPGQQIEVASEGGVPLVVTVPDGLVPGDKFLISSSLQQSAVYVAPSP